MYEMSYMRKPYYPFIKTKKADDYFYGKNIYQKNECYQLLAISLAGINTLARLFY